MAGRGAGGHGGRADVACWCSCSGQIQPEPYEAFISFSLLRSTAASAHIGGVSPVEEPSPLPRDTGAFGDIFACVISLSPASLLLHSCHPGRLLCCGRWERGAREPVRGPDGALGCRASAEEDGEEEVPGTASIPSLPSPPLPLRALSLLPGVCRCWLLEAGAHRKSKPSCAL